MRLIPLFRGYLTRVCGVSINASFHGGSNDTIVAMSDLGGQKFTVLSQWQPYHPALTSSHETVHTEFYLWSKEGD